MRDQLILLVAALLVAAVTRGNGALWGLVLKMNPERLEWELVGYLDDLGKPIRKQR